MTTIDIGTIFTFFSQVADSIVQTPLFHSYGLLILFLFPVFTISLIPLPIEIPLAALVYARFDLITLLVTTFAAMMAGNMVLYYSALYGKIVIRRTTIFEEIDDSHFLHKHRWIMFSTFPAFFILGDALILYAVSKHMSVFSFVLPLMIGTFIRSVIAMLLVLGILAIPHFLNT